MKLHLMKNRIVLLFFCCCLAHGVALAQRLHAELGLETSVQSKFFPITSSVQLGPSFKLGMKGKVASVLVSSSLYSYRGLSDAFSSASRFSNSLEVRCFLEERRYSYVHVFAGRNRNTFISSPIDEPKLQLASEKIVWAHTVVGIGYGLNVLPELRLGVCFAKEVANAQPRKSQCSYFSFGLGYNVASILYEKKKGIEP